MNPLREQRVHLSGNPIKSQGETLLCLRLIIGSLPYAEAAALLPEVDGDGTVGQKAGKAKGERETFSPCLQQRHVAPHESNLLGFFFFSCVFCFFFSSSLLSLVSLFMSLPPSPPIPSQFLFNLLFIAQQVMKNLCPEPGIEINAKRKQKQFILTV